MEALLPEVVTVAEVADEAVAAVSSCGDDFGGCILILENRSR